MYAVVKELEEEFVTDERKFTLDGHLVGSIGEVVAAYAFGLTLYPSGNNTHDGESEDGRKVQIKLTGGIRGIGLSSEPEYLIVLQLRECRGDPEVRGQRRIALTLLRKLQPEVSPIQIKEHGFPPLG